MEPSSLDEFDDNVSDGELWDGEGDSDGNLMHTQASPSSTTLSSATAGAAFKPSLPLQKRRRVTRACDECRRKKIKCDGKQPCTHCTVYSYDCTYDQPSNRRRNPAPQYIESLEHRVHRAESLLHLLIPNLDLTDPGIDAAVAQGWIPGALGKGTLPAAAEIHPVRPPPMNLDQKSDMNLESMVRAVAQMDLDEQGNWDYHGHSSGLSFVRRMREQLGDIMGPDTVATPFVKSRPLSTVLDSPRSITDSPSAETPALAAELPSRVVAYQLCRNSIDDAASLLRSIHQPTFWKSFERIYNIAPEDYTNEDHKFLPLLYSVLAVGCLFGDDENSSLNKYGYETAIGQGFGYFKAARQMMDIADCRSLTHIQAVIFMIIFMQSSSRLSQCYAYVGVALRAALRMGLHRSYTGNFNPIEAETRKRVFWVIRKMDIYVGAMLGLPQTLSDAAIDQDFPTEVDDEYITEDGIQPMPEGEVSLIAAFNAHTRLIILLSKIVEKVYPIKVQDMQKAYSVPFSTVREIEDDLEKWKVALPPILSPCEAPAKYTRVQQLLRLAYAHAQVMLYRPFLHFIATDKRSKPIDKRAYACAASYVNVSRNIIHITTQMKQKGLLNGSFWFIMYTTFFSIMSLIYFAAENPDNPTTAAVINDAQEGRKVLASLAKRSMAADRTTATLDAVFARIPKWVMEGGVNVMSKKRRHDSSLTPNPQAARSHTQVPTVNSHPSTPGLCQRSSTFPKLNSPLPKVETAFNPNWPPSNSANGLYPYTINGFHPEGNTGFNPMNSASPTSNPLQQYSLPPSFANPELPELSAMMFSSESEPLGYPNQPLTTFESNQFAKANPYLNEQAFSSVDGPSPTVLSEGGRGGTENDSMEAQFAFLPSYMTHPQTHGTGVKRYGMNVPQGHNPTVNVTPNGSQWPEQQPMPQDMGNINIQDAFGGSEWNPMIMDPGFQI